MKITISNCNKLEEALHIRKQYTSLCPNSEEIVIDMSSMLENTPQELLIGVLININTTFLKAVVYNLNPPLSKLKKY